MPTVKGEKDPKTQLVRTFRLKSRQKMLIEIDGKVAGDGLEEPGLCLSNQSPLPKSGASYLPPLLPDVKCVARGIGAGAALGSMSLSQKCLKSRSDRF